MKVKISLPDGRVATITEKTACVKGSEERCMPVDEEKAKILIEYAIDKGWKVQKLET